MLYYTFIIPIILFFSFIIYLFLLKSKINKLEKKILYKFKEKNNQIPSLYYITKGHLIKHEKIFEEILMLKKKDLSENKYVIHLSEKGIIYKLIHNELNFIFRVCNKHPKLNKNSKFLFIKDNIIDISNELGEKILLYKNIVSKFNKLIILKNITIIGYLIPIKKIISI